MLKKIRIALAIVFFIGVTLLFLDFTGTVNVFLGWMAKVQFLPALLALNVGVVAVLILLTLIFGRIYCSVICPLGIYQDIVSRVSGSRKKKKSRFTYSPAKQWLRYAVLAVFIILMLIGLGGIAALVAPYSAYGRMVQNLLQPVWIWGNNILSQMAAHVNSYAFYEKEIWLRSSLTLGISLATALIVAVLAWKNGRTWCNTICPVGTVLSFFARFSWLRITIDSDRCISCGLCERKCKASCIDAKNHSVDLSRCVDCFDCIDSCSKGALSYAPHSKKHSADVQLSASSENGRRNFLSASALALGVGAMKSAEKTVDGGLALITDKKVAKRTTPIVPPGAKSLKHFTDHCTACQLCVANCPNDVLRPSTNLIHLMKPESSYERGYCRPECTRCSEVCPTGAIQKTSREEKSSISIGYAVWVRKNCIPAVEGVRCGNCARHCPTGAIQMVPMDANNPKSPYIPVVNTERCIGCGACENLCPARPFSAIYVEGRQYHKNS